MSYFTHLYLDVITNDRFQVFNRSKTQEEYVKLVATLIMKLRDYKAKVCHQNYNKNDLMTILQYDFTTELF